MKREIRHATGITIPITIIAAILGAIVFIFVSFTRTIPAIWFCWTIRYVAFK